MFDFRRLAGLAAAAVLVSAAAAQAAPLIDFTDRTQWTGSGAAATYSQVYGGLTVNLSTTPANEANFDQDYDGTAPNSGCATNGGDLACVSDGLGIEDDEIGPGFDEIARLDFVGGPVAIDALYFLDLFKAADDSEAEQAVFRINGDNATITDLTAVENFSNNGGFAKFIVDLTGVDYIQFAARNTNDEVGVADYALAGVNIVPLPAAAFLLIGGIAGLGFVSRKRKAA